MRKQHLFGFIEIQRSSSEYETNLSQTPIFAFYSRLVYDNFTLSAKLTNYLTDDTITSKLHLGEGMFSGYTIFILWKLSTFWTKYILNADSLKNFKTIILRIFHFFGMQWFEDNAWQTKIRLCLNWLIILYCSHFLNLQRSNLKRHNWKEILIN